MGNDSINRPSRVIICDERTAERVAEICERLIGYYDAHVEEFIFYAATQNGSWIEQLDALERFARAGRPVRFDGTDEPGGGE